MSACSCYADAPPLHGCLGGEERLVSVRPLHPQETVGGVTDAAGQQPVSEHGVDHRTLPVTGPESHTALKYMARYAIASYHITSHHIRSHRIVSYDVMLCHFLLCLIVLFLLEAVEVHGYLSSSDT